MMTPEQEAISKTQFAQASIMTGPVVKHITEKMAPRAMEFMSKPLHESVDIVYEEFVDQLKGLTHEYLVYIAARWGTEHVMQGIEQSKKIKEYVETLKKQQQS